MKIVNAYIIALVFVFSETTTYYSTTENSDDLRGLNLDGPAVEDITDSSDAASTKSQKAEITNVPVTVKGTTKLATTIDKIGTTTIGTAVTEKISVTTALSTGPSVTSEPSVTTTGSSVTTTEPSVTTTGSSVTATEPSVTTTGSSVTTTGSSVTTTGSSVTATEPSVTTMESTPQTSVPSVTTTITTVTTEYTLSLFGYQTRTMSPAELQEADVYESVPWELRQTGWNPDSGIPPNFTDLPDSVTPATKVKCTCLPSCSCKTGGKGVVFASSGEMNDEANNKTGNWSLICGRILNYNRTVSTIATTMNPSSPEDFEIPDGYCCYNCMEMDTDEPAVGRRRKRATRMRARCTAELGSVSVTNNLVTGLDFQYNVSRKIGQCEVFTNTTYVGAVQNIAACSPSLVIPGATNACSAIAEVARCTQKVDVIPPTSGNPECTLIKATTVAPPAAGAACQDTFYESCRPTCKPSCPTTCVVNNTAFDAQGKIINQWLYGEWTVMCGRKYLIVHNYNPMTFQNAWDFCCSLGMTLINLYPPSIYYCIKDNSEKYVKFGRQNWLAGSNSGCKDARWCNPDIPLPLMSYPSWRTGEPNGDGAMAADLSYSTAKFDLYDDAVTIKKPVACEVPWTCTATCPVTTCNKDLSKFDGNGVLINPSQYGTYYNACGTNYLFITASLTYQDSFNSCCSLGMKLLSVETKAEYDCLINLAKSNNITRYSWTSGSQLDCEFNFHWCGSNTPMLPIREWWEGDFPHGGDRHFVEIHFSGTKWGFLDNLPTFQANYICED